MALTRFVGGNVNGFPARLRRRPTARRWMARGPVALLLLALALALGVLPAQAQTVTLISNSEQGTNVSGERVSAEADDIRLQAQGFTTGDHPHGYTLSTITAKILRWDSGDALQVSIWSARSSGIPGTSLHVLENPDPITNNVRNTFTAPAGSMLEPETDYFVLFEATAGDFNIRTVQHAGENSGAASGWSIEDRAITKHNDEDWEPNDPDDYVVRVTIDGSVVPGPYLVGNLEQLGTEATTGVGRISNPPDPPSEERNAQGFTTGSHRHGYTLSDLRVFISGITSGTEVSVSIYTADSPRQLGSLLYTLDNPSSIVASRLNTFTAPANATLEPETSYFVLFEAPSGTYFLEAIASNEEDPGQAVGWSIGDSLQTIDVDGGGTLIFQFSLRIEINGTVNDVKLVGNTAQSRSSFVGNAGFTQGVTYLTAQRFTTGGNGAGYALTSVGAVVHQWRGNDEGKVSIYSADSSGNPGSSLYVLTNPPSIELNILTTFTAEDGATLERETNYFVVFEATLGAYSVRLNEDGDDDAGGADGWSIFDSVHGKVGSANWIQASYPVRIQIRGFNRPNTPAGGEAAISGRKAVGQVLTADTSGITDANGLDNAAFSYQWVRVDGDDERDIPGATGSSYTLVEADYDKKIRVRVSFVDDAGYAESVTSPATGEVNRGPELLRVEYRPTRVELWYDESLIDDPLPPRSAFSISINGAGGAQPSSVVVSGEAVLLTLPTPVESGDRVSVSYAVPTSNLLRDEDGRPAPGFTARSAADVTGTWYGVVRVAMSSGAYQSTEPRTGQAEVTVGVYPRSPVDIMPPDLEFWVEIETSDGTATAVADYVPLTAHRVRLMGTHTQENPATATILVNADGVMEGRSETFGVGLNGEFDSDSAPAARPLLDPSRVTITDVNESSLELVASPHRVVEGRTQEIELEVRATDDDGSSSDECRIAIPLSNIRIRFGGSAERGADKDYTLSTVEGDLDDIDLPPCGTAKVTVRIETKSDINSEFEETIQPRLVLPLALDDRVLRGLLRADEITIADPYSSATCEHEQVAYCGELTVGRFGGAGLGYASFDNLQGGALSPKSFHYEGTEYRVLELDVGDSQYGSISLLLDPSGGNVFKEGYKLHLGDHVVRFAEGEYWEGSERFTWRMQDMRFPEGEQVPVYISRIGPDVTPPRLVNAYVTTGGDRVILEFSEELNIPGDLIQGLPFRLCVLNSHSGCPQDDQSLAEIAHGIEQQNLISASGLEGSQSFPCTGGDNPCLTSGYGSDERRVIHLPLKRVNPIHASDHLKLSFDRSAISPGDLTDAAGNHLRSFRFRTVTNHSTRSVPGCQDDDIWCAIMTVGQSGQARGFSEQAGVGALWDRGFHYQGTQYITRGIVVNASRLLTLAVNPGPSAVSAFSNSKFDLHLGGHKLNFADAMVESDAFQWSDVGLTWSAGDEVAVRLTESEGRGQDAPPDTEPLTASLDSAPERHDGDSTFEVRVAFSEAISTSFRDLGDAFTVGNGEIINVKRVDKRSDLWSLKVAPGGDDPVSLTLEAGQDCGEEQAPCTADGRSLSETLTIRVPGPEAPASLSAHLANQPTEHDGSSAFEVWVGFSHDLRNSEDALRGYPTVTGGTLQSAGRVDGRGDLWKFTIAPGGDGDVGFSMAAADRCSDEEGVPCSEEGRPLSNDLSTTINGPTLISVADAAATEGGTMTFTVSLSRAPAAPISVDYHTGDGTAAAGEDYTAASGAVTFLPTQQTKTVSVSLLDDGESEDDETFTLTLSNPSTGRLSDAQATGVIADDDVEDSVDEGDEGDDASEEDTARDGATDLGDITDTGRAAYSRLQSLDGEDETTDWFRFAITESRKVMLGLRQLDADAVLTLETLGGDTIRTKTGTGVGSFSFRETLQAGTYYVRVDAAEVGRNDYKLKWRTSEAQ